MESIGMVTIRWVKRLHDEVNQHGHNLMGQEDA